uniref:DUF7650 domain-containing protein n=1 Tax=Oryza barthii TaxID=65489 RepID=A0A0D3FIE7_9ORYZ
MIFLGKLSGLVCLQEGGTQRSQMMSALLRIALSIHCAWFSRSELTKGTHYFDFASDVLKKVVADLVCLKLEVDEMGNGVNAKKKGFDTDIKLNQDVPLDGYHELPKFTVIDTNMVQGKEALQSFDIDPTVKPIPFISV